MKKVSQFSSKVEATIAAESLAEKGIKTEVIGSRDYSSHVAGTDFGSFELHVDKDKIAEAEELLRASNINLVDHDVIEISPSSYLKRAVIYALVGAVMVPLLGNLVSLRNLFLYLKTKQSPFKKTVLALVVLALQVPSVATIYFLLQKISMPSLF